MVKTWVALGAPLALGLCWFACSSQSSLRHATPDAMAVDAAANRGGTPATPLPPPPPLAPFVEKGLDWLCGAQQEDGGWGAGSHARQEIRDAHAVPTDPATTAAAAMAFLRAGSRLDRGEYQEVLRKATDHLLRTVETAPEGPQITAQRGTQPQAKMGQNVDTAMAAQFFARLLHETELDAELRPRVTAALDVCLRKIEGSQGQDGSWAAGGWAPVLQSAQMSTALELGERAGRTIDKDKLSLARDYQRRQVMATTAAGPGAPAGALDFAPVADSAAAGVSLYASAANQRGVAAEAKVAEQLIEQGKREGKVAADAEVQEETLVQLGVEPSAAQALVLSVAQNAAAKTRAFDEDLLSGFGNNGGEEFLSYQMTSEALVIDGGDEWATWTTKMHERLAKVQNGDGSWSGHHCITSPAFCTAAAIACLTADRDVEWLRHGAQLAAK